MAGVSGFPARSVVGLRTGLALADSHAGIGGLAVSRVGRREWHLQMALRHGSRQCNTQVRSNARSAMSEDRARAGLHRLELRRFASYSRTKFSMGMTKLPSGTILKSNRLQNCRRVSTLNAYSEITSIADAVHSLHSELHPKSSLFTPKKLQPLRSRVALSVIGGSESQRADVISALLLSEERAMDDSWDPTQVVRLLATSTSDISPEKPVYIRYGEHPVASADGSRLDIPAPLLRDNPLDILLFPDSAADSQLALDSIFEASDVVLLVTDPVRGVRGFTENAVLERAFKKMIPPPIIICLSLPPSLPLPSLQSSLSSISRDLETTIAKSTDKAEALGLPGLMRNRAEVNLPKVVPLDAVRGKKAYSNLHDAIRSSTVEPTSFQHELAASGIGPLRNHLISSYLLDNTLPTTLSIAHLSRLLRLLQDSIASLHRSAESISLLDAAFRSRCDEHRESLARVEDEVKADLATVKGTSMDVSKAVIRGTSTGALGAAVGKQEWRRDVERAVGDSLGRLERVYSTALGRLSSVPIFLPHLFSSFPAPSSSQPITLGEFLLDASSARAEAEEQARARASNAEVEGVFKEARSALEKEFDETARRAEAGGYGLGAGLFLSATLPALAHAYMQLPVTLALLATAGGSLASLLVLQTWWTASRNALATRCDRRVEKAIGEANSMLYASLRHILHTPLDKTVEAYERAFSRRWAVLEGRRSRCREIARDVEQWRMEAEKARELDKTRA
ncbi:hypothetical protein M427DRAFT_51025 [Gonapodya prolifera JEL478]|uniref:Uncharacterized protein n=1 Tax=Gonapodya prolifera (strain JEL478) TaxID=1344416 RepID=A0A139AXX6_GONPJ|nr:hypothetical protein M427DRAFT_51025 [Gonapodya prolifera JEL478]|eukprot:KXS21602.1 hypothetical protein M427DRAFT_51025 [Gonapodya prolifera JEL478]